jgi:hypothetical protein
MGLWIDTVGNSNVAIGICGRCSQKFPLVELSPDLNYPGLLVCADDYDDLDPYRLPARETEDITLQFPRPDVPLTTVTVAPGTPAWPPSSFPDDGLNAPQLPPNGNTT